MTMLVLFLSLLRFLQTGSADSKCYFPNGEESDDYPCDPGAETSACCGGFLGNVCHSNKLCLGSNGNTIRASCTDKDWESPECAMFCLWADTGGTDLISCSNVTSSDTSYCCDHTVDCCDTGVARFDILPSKPDVWASWDRDATQYSVIGTMYEGNPTSTALASTTGIPTTTVTPSNASPTASVPTAEPSEDPSPESGLSTGAKTGIGVGGGAAFLIIALLAFLLWRSRRKSKAASTAHGLPPSFSGTGSTGLYEGSTLGSSAQSYYTQKRPQEMDAGGTVRAELPAYI